MSEPGIRFAEFELDPVRRRLTRSGQPVPLPGKPMELLLVLVDARDRVVGRQELLDRVWPDVVVEEANLTQTVSVLRKALGESPGTNEYLVTVPGVGYRFVADVAAPDGVRWTDPEPSRSPRSRRSLVLLAAAFAVAVVAIVVVDRLDGPPRRRAEPPLRGGSIAVLPFQTDGFSEPATDDGVALADGVIRRLAAAGFDVRPTGDVLEYRNPLADTPAEAGRQLGVELVIHGATQAVGDATRATVQVIRLPDGSLVGSAVAIADGTLAGHVDGMAADLARQLARALGPATTAPRIRDGDAASGTVAGEIGDEVEGASERRP